MMNDARPFSRKLLQERLHAAKGETSGSICTDIISRYAGLAMVKVPENAIDALSNLRDWPFYLYTHADEKTREDVLRWLMEHVEPISWLDLKYSWSEQWQLELLRFISADEREAIGIAKAFQDRELSVHSRRLYSSLREVHDCDSILLYWLKHLSNAREWTDVIEDATDALPVIMEESPRSELYKVLVEAHLQRTKINPSDHNDGEKALHLLFAVQNERLWANEFESLLVRAAEAALPSDLRTGRGKPTNIFTNVYQGLVRTGKRIGKIFGGRESQVPYHDDILKSAPTLLTNRNVEEYLASSKILEEEFQQIMKTKRGDLEAIAIAGTLSISGFWTLAQIDDSVLHAMTFSSAGHPESFWSLREIAGNYDGNTDALARLSGYVAEQQVAFDLAQEGHIVEFPDSPTQPGWDLLVDGQQVQVKCTMDPDYVTEHFEQYPDIPVVVNAELADQFGDHPMILVDQHLSYDEVTETAEESIEALADFGDFDDLLPIPIFTIVFAAIRNVNDLYSVPMEEYLKHVGIDVVTRTAGGGGGSVIGGAIGSFFGPVGTVILGTIGGFIGVVAGATGSDAINRSEICTARDSVVNSFRNFAKWFRVTLLVPRVESLAERHKNLAAWAQESSCQGKALRCVAAFYAASTEMLKRAKDLENWLSKRENGDDFDCAYAGWVSLRESKSFYHNELKVRCAKIEDVLQKYTELVHPAASGSIPDSAEA